MTRISRVGQSDGRPAGSIDPRLVRHQFKPAYWNEFFCAFCSNPKPAHQKCGHAVCSIGCPDCAAALFGRRHANWRRRKNLEAMKAAGLAPGGTQ